MERFKQPLVNQLIGRLPDRHPDNQEAYDVIRRQMRRYSGTSIVDSALRVLWSKYATKMDELQIFPWHILLIVKWALKDPHVALRTGPSISSEAFDDLRQQVYDLMGVELKLHPPENAHLAMRMHLQQIEFQRPAAWGFLRWSALIARQPANYPSHRQLIEELGLPVDHLIDLSFGLFAAVHSRQLPIAPGWFEPMRASYGQSVDKFLALVARDLPSLRDELRREQPKRAPLRQELHEFPRLKCSPMVRMRNGHIYCWHPMVLARGLEDLVHLRLSELQAEYTQPFSKLFEKYVVELAKTMDQKALSDEEYLALFENEKKSNVEALIACGDCNVLIEAKMSLFADDVLLTDSEVQIYQKTKRLRDGIKQAWNIGRTIREVDSPLPACAAAEHDFLLLVTSRELFVGDGNMLQRLYRAGDFDYPDAFTKANLPLCNIFIMSIESYEKLSCAVASGAVSLPALLKEAATKNQDPSTSSMLFDGYLEPYVKHWGLPDLLLNARTQSERRLAVAFGESADAFERLDAPQEVTEPPQ